jgi:hypothetical protein
MKLSLFLSVGLLPLLLMGCPGPRMVIKVTNASSKQLSLEMMTRDELLGTSRPQEISSVSFYRKSKQKKDMDILWSVKSQKEKGIQLTKIVYGITPPGFSATIPQPLLPGDRLEVSFYGEDVSFRSVEITVSQ